MGTWTDAFIAPAEPTLLPAESFGRLVVDLARERLVRTPWSLLAGRLCVNASLNWTSVSGKARYGRPAVGTSLSTERHPLWQDDDLWRDDDPPPWGDSHEEARLLATGERILDVLPALRAAPYAQEDIAVVFPCLDFRHRGIADFLIGEDHRTMLVCFALARPQIRPLAADDTAEPGGEVHPVRTCVVHTYKLARRYGPASAITAVAARHLGPDLVTGRTWG
ncbi:hypothetical protein [Streptomyces sp. S465]|uniref:hypothetical protein n=1 Tax=Streptomyces sp. S465 TaxID=2979468 RepID=UPI0022A8AADE|nr:hypothetical protein [Streptomyces sp. S465]WAP59749.1 hypothetical protein N6H00_35055 [Streptomyces sp. S465]